tara:strand:+ start:2134 stop:2613 length:480 start_codon:yes stop_codon:yes gene_type:complete
MLDQEMRYWPRLGIYVTRIDAESYCSKVGGQHTHLDDEIEEFVPVSTHDEAAMRAEVAQLFENPPLEAPPLSEDIEIMLKAIEFEDNRVATIKKWIKEEGMDKQDAKDRFQAEMDAMVREALGLPEETEQEIAYRERAQAVIEEREAQAALENAEDEEE